MFEQKRAGSWNFNWGGIILVVVFVLGVFWIFRQNPPDYAADSSNEKKIMWSEGTIANGPLEVQGGDILTFPLNLNKRSGLDATFRTGDNAKRLAFSVLAASDLKSLRAGEDVKLVINTGPVPRGTIKHVLEPGYYVIVFDNRMNAQSISVIESNIVVD